MTDGDRTDRNLTGQRPQSDRRAVTIEEAAPLLGLSPDAIRKRLFRGTLAGEKRGRSWVVFLPQLGTEEATADRPQTGRSDRSTTEDRSEGDRELIEQLRSEVDYLRTELRNTHILLAQALPHISQLDTSGKPPVTHQDDPEQAQPSPMTLSISTDPSAFLMDRFVFGLRLAIHSIFAISVTIGTAVSGLTILSYFGVALTSTGRFFSWDNLGKAAIISTIVAVPLGIIAIVVTIWLARQSPSAPSS